MRQEYYCKECDYSTKIKTLYEQHKTTKKHLKLSDTDKDLNLNKTCIECNKEFSTPSNYYKHRNKYHKTITKQVTPTVTHQVNIQEILAENVLLKTKLANCEEELLNAQKKIIQLYESLVAKIENKTD